MATSKIDRDLESALSDPAGDGATSPLVADTAPIAAPSKKGNVRLLAILLVMAGGIVTLVMTSFSGAAVYSKSVDQLLAAKGELAGRRVRVDGNLVHGTLERRDTPCEYKFKLTKGGQTLAVHYAQCVVPDTFRDVPGMDLGVTVEGKLSQAGDFEATQVLAKCPSKYEMNQAAAAGAQRPKDEKPAM